MPPLTDDDSNILAVSPPHVWPDVGAPIPPPIIWRRPAGVYELPVITPTRHRVLYSVLATGEQVNWALVAQGGDYYAARRFLRFDLRDPTPPLHPTRQEYLRLIQ